MQFYDVIENRKSIKKFKNSEVSKEKLSRIINAAMMAPSWKNNTSYKFILVDNEVEKNKLADSVINDTDDAADSIRQAPLAAVIVADPNASGEVAGREYYLVDSAIAMEHFILAATAEGYGTCFIASIDEDRIRDILSIPKNFRVVAMTPMGEIAETKEHNPKKNVSDIVFLNRWDFSYNDKVKH